MNARIDVVGLGPGSPNLVTLETRELLVRGPVLLRTRHHPTVAALDPGGHWANCDDLYQGGASFEKVYGAVVQRVLAAAGAGPLVYAVPGHPLVAEHTVTALLAAARGAGVRVLVHPAVSFADVAAVALGRDLGSVQLCDALDLRIDAQRPALISQVFDRDTATSLKLRLLEAYPADHRLVLLRALGTEDADVREIPLAGLDHMAAGYLDALYVPPLEALEDLRRFDGLYAVVERLNAADGCPWDREQTHASLRPHLLEECYEALEAIDSGDAVRLAEELGDVLLQVLMHAAVATRSDEFSFADVTETIARKLIRRHPHVFGEGVANSAEEVYRNWEALKQEEKPGASILAGVPGTLPALAASQAIQGRARRVGFDWPGIEDQLEKLAEELREFARAGDAGEREDEFCDILMVVAGIAGRLGIDAEQALRGANEKFRRRFAYIEAKVAEQGRDLRTVGLAGLDALWDEAKLLEGEDG